MALSKEIEKESGIKPLYHRIKSVILNEIEQKSIVIVEEYLDESYRDLAKKALEASNKIAELKIKAETTEDAELSRSFLDKANIIEEENAELFSNQYSLGTVSIPLEYIPEDTTIEGFYKELEKLDTYNKAKKI